MGFATGTNLVLSRRLGNSNYHKNKARTAAGYADMRVSVLLLRLESGERPSLAPSGFAYGLEVIEIHILQRDHCLGIGIFPAVAAVAGFTAAVVPVTGFGGQLVDTVGHGFSRLCRRDCRC